MGHGLFRLNYLNMVFDSLLQLLKVRLDNALFHVQLKPPFQEMTTKLGNVQCKGLKLLLYFNFL